MYLTWSAMTNSPDGSCKPNWNEVINGDSTTTTTTPAPNLIDKITDVISQNSDEDDDDKPVSACF